LLLVVPAKAGIQCRYAFKLGPGLRGGDSI
jgi:hypothetical protein